MSQFILYKPTIWTSLINISYYLKKKYRHNFWWNVSQKKQFTIKNENLIIVLLPELKKKSSRKKLDCKKFIFSIGFQLLAN